MAIKLTYNAVDYKALLKKVLTTPNYLHWSCVRKDYFTEEELKVLKELNPSD